VTVVIVFLGIPTRSLKLPDVYTDLLDRVWWLLHGLWPGISSVGYVHDWSAVRLYNVATLPSSGNPSPIPDSSRW
jgi:hypothetical protein